MSKKASDERTEAFEIYKKHNGNVKLKDIAGALNISEKTISKWKNRYDWKHSLESSSCKNTTMNNEYDNKNTTIDNEYDNKNTTIDNEFIAEKPLKSNVSKTNATVECKTNETLKTNSPNPFARYGNRNSFKNKGGNGAVNGNKYAVKTGEFETIYFEELSDNERKILFSNNDIYSELIREINILIIREKRMLSRIIKLESTSNDMVVKNVSKTKDGTKEITTTNVVPVNDKILELEESLTRIQSKKQRLLELLYKYKTTIDLPLKQNKEGLEDVEIISSKIEQILDENDTEVQAIYNKIYLGYNELNDQDDKKK